MNLSLALNAIFGSFLVVILMFVNYIRKFSINRFQRNIFCYLLLFHLITMISDMVYIMFSGVSGRHIYIILYVASVLYYIFQVLSFCYMAVFIDYMVFKNIVRTKKIIFFSNIYLVIHLAVILANFWYGFYFHINPDNVFEAGDHYYLRFIIAYLPLIFGLGVLVYSFSSYNKSDIAMLSILLSFFIIGSSLDILYGTIRLVWAWGTSALLYAYFFTVRSEARIDPLTGIGNRFSFNEFTDRLCRRITGESWAIVMIDMDHFKSINDTLGHQEGDNALCDMASIIKACIGKTDFAARYGGDEFALATKVEKGVENGISALINKIQDAVEKYNAKNTRPFNLEISYGYDIFTADGKQSIDDFLNHIDGLMYKHKQGRRRSGDKVNRIAG